MVKDINSGSSSGLNVMRPTSIGNTLYFIATDGTNGYELWKSDGTSTGTVMVKDIVSGAGNGIQSVVNMQPTAIGNTLYFTAADTTNGKELWKTDGTSTGTVMVKDIRAGVNSGSPAYLTVFGNTLYFTAYDGTNGIELWKSDGTSTGTVMVKDIWSGSSSSSPNSITAFDNMLCFSANDGTNGNELWCSELTSDGSGVAMGHEITYS
jgi:ELWxxDGT repeat protein